MGFAEEFINGVLAGQQTLANKQDQRHRQMRMQFEQEDRGIEKEILQHRIRDLKIQERLQARQAAQQNLEMLSGTPERDIPTDRLMPMPTDPQEPMRMRPIDIPGIDFEGVSIPGMQATPQTMEQLLAAQMATRRMEALSTPRVLGENQVLTMGDEVLARGPQDPYKDHVWAYTRDARGQTVRRFIPRAEAASQDWEVEPVPRRTSNINVFREQIDIPSIVEGLRRGDYPPDQIPQSTEGLAIRSAAMKAGIPLRSMQDQARALAQHYQTLNSGQIANVRLATDEVSQALDILEEANKTWNDSGWGKFSWASMAAAENNLLGAEAKRTAMGVKEAAALVGEHLQNLKTGGSNPSNRVLDEIGTALSAYNSPNALDRTIQRLRTSVAIRRGAISGLEAVLPDAPDALPAEPPPPPPGPGRGRAAGPGPAANVTPAAAVPADVAAALGSEGPGRYTLSDGSVWLKDQSGRITKGQ